MSKTKIALIFSIFIFITSACGATALTVEPSTPTAIVTIEPTQTQPSIPVATQEQPQIKIPLSTDEVTRVSLAEAKNAYDNKLAIFVDVRDKQAYDTEHIKGAINIQLGEFEVNPTDLDLDKNQWIIIYCT